MEIRRFVSRAIVDLRSLIRAVWRHAWNGWRRVPESVRQERLDVCRQCPAMLGDRCAFCGCYLSVKTSWPAESCPIGKWDSRLRHPPLSGMKNGQG